MPEETDIILTQKIRNPNNSDEDKWIDIFKIDKNKNIIFTKAIVTTDNLEENSVTYEKMYNGDDPDLKPVRSDTIQNYTIQNTAMYQISDEELGENADDIRPVSTNTIQKDAIIDSKIQNETITLRKLKEPLAISEFLNPFGDDSDLYAKLYENPEDQTVKNHKIIFYSTETENNAWEKIETEDKKTS